MTGRPGAALVLLSLFVTATAATAALSLGSWLAATFGLPALLALVVSVRLPTTPARMLVMAARGVAAAVALFAFGSTLYPIVPDRVVGGVASAGAHLLVLLAGVLLLGRVAPPAGGTVIAALGALVCATLPADAGAFRVAGATAAAAFVAWLLVQDDEQPFATAPAPRLLPAALFLGLTAAIAAGIAWGLPLAQPRVEQAVAEMINSDGSATTGMATESRLGDVEKLARSQRLALRVYSDVPQDLRVRAFTFFDGRTWRVDRRPGRRLQETTIADGRWPVRDDTPGRDMALPGFPLPDTLVASRIVVRGPERGAMPAPAHSRAVRVDASGDVVLGPSDVLLPEGAVAIYAVLNAPKDASTAAPGPETLELPAQLDPRVRELAAELARNASGAEDKVARTVGHFHGGFRYSLDVGAFRTRDPVAEFLFDKRKGYCEYFATATTLLLRLQGVPARYVTGYAVRSFQRVGTHFVVRDTDAHAWAEAWVPGRGWVEADATPPGDYEALHGDVETGAFDALRAWWDMVVARFTQGGLPSLARGLAHGAAEHPLVTSGVLLLLLAGPVRRWIRRPRAAQVFVPVAAAPGLAGELRSLLQGVDALCASRGAARPPARAPREHVAHPKVPLSADERAACLHAVELLYAAAYGGTAVHPDELAAAARRVNEAGAPRPPA